MGIRKSFPMLAAFLCLSVPLMGGSAMDTIAGNGEAKSEGDGVDATDASINRPLCLATDALGYVFVSDNEGAYVRVLYGQGGVKISRVAGTGTAGFSGENVAALDSMVNRPSGLAVDRGNNLYVADSGNSRIRRITAGTGTFITVAGGGSGGLGYLGPAPDATLSTVLGGVAVDASGNLYFADTGDHRVRRVRADNGNIETIAGTGVAGFTGDGLVATQAALNSPADVALDSSENLYIADQGNNRVRKVVLSTGIISTVAGGGTVLGDGKVATEARLNGPRGLIVAGNDLYVSDTGNHRIRRMALDTAKIVTVAGVGAEGFDGDGFSPTAAKINSPVGLMAAPDGRLFFCDTGNNRVRAFVPETGNRAPVALDEDYDIAASTAFAFNLLATDPDGDSISYSILGDPVYGTLSDLNAVTGSVTYTPPAGFGGTDSFTFQVTDGTLKSYYGVVILNVGSSDGSEWFTPSKATFALSFKKADSDKLSLSAAVEDLKFHGTALEDTPISSAEVTVGGGATAFSSGELALTKNAYKGATLKLSVKTGSGQLKLSLKKLNLRETLAAYGAANETTEDPKYLTVPVSFVFRAGTQTIRLRAWFPVIYTAKVNSSGKGRQ